MLEQGYYVPPTDRLYKTPINLAVSSDARLLLVVCANSGSLVVVDTTDGRVVREVAVGDTPHDLAIGADGKRIYVTNRFDDSVSVIDANRWQIISTVEVGADPHGVGVGRGYGYVLNTGENTISVIDIETLRETNRLSAGRGPWSLAMAADGRAIYVTNVRPHLTGFQQPHRSEITVVDGERAVVTERPAVPDANMLQGIAAFPAMRGDDPQPAALFTLVRTKNLVPMTRLAQGWTITSGLGVLWTDGRVDQVLLDEPNNALADPTDVAVSPDGRYALVTSGGTDQVAVVEIERLLELINAATDREREARLPNHLGSSGAFVLERIAVGRNPRGVAFDPNGGHAYVANALADSISVIDTRTWSVIREITLGGPDVTTELRRGETLFHSAEITFGRQFSCRSCHPDGHVNGLAFDIEADGIGMSPVDNRSLRGILDTAPFKWEGTNPSLRRQCGARLAVFFTRLAPYEPEELDALVRYISTIRRRPNRHREPEGLTPAQRRGKMIFERSQTNYGATIPEANRCGTCHNSVLRFGRRRADVGTAMWFDREAHDAVADPYNPEPFGELGVIYFYQQVAPVRELDIPHLFNVYDSAPYLHNGSAATLEEVWTRFNIVNRHGVTTDLTRRQFNDLIEYVKAM